VRRACLPSRAGLEPGYCLSTFERWSRPVDLLRETVPFLVGMIVPPIVVLIIRANWSGQFKFIVAFIPALVLGFCTSLLAGELGVCGAMEQKSGLSKSGRREKRSRYPCGHLHREISIYGSSSGSGHHIFSGESYAKAIEELFDERILR
jgi:hypothetical protein